MNDVILKRGDLDTGTLREPPALQRQSSPLSCAPTSIAAGRAKKLSEGPGAPRHVPRKVLPIHHSAPSTSHAWPQRVVLPHYQRSTLGSASDLGSCGPPSALPTLVPRPSFHGFTSRILMDRTRRKLTSNPSSCGKGNGGL